ncbi:MAG TPA: metallophosphoesterase [Kofleriaceae bacterium]|nr:metallophosphoesterase [Kofleriaceae bacterium]
MQEGPKVVTVASTCGPVLVSADLHGNLADFERLRDVFLASDARGEQPVWISVGDWVHGPPDASARDDVLDRFGKPLYAYCDETPAILEQLFALMDRFGDRVVSVLGNHEHAHIGGRRTSKFHRDEAAHLEKRLTPAAVAELRRRFATWPLVVRIASCGVAVTHGAPVPASVAEFEQVRFDGSGGPSSDVLHSAMVRYGFCRGEDTELLVRLSEPGCELHVLVHGHDREEEGYYPTGAAALLLCTSFGARTPRKTYLWLDRATRYTSIAALRDGVELRRLWPEIPDEVPDEVADEAGAAKRTRAGGDAGVTS